MGRITVKPERKPEQRRGTEGNGDFDWLALRSGVLGVDSEPFENGKPLGGQLAHAKGCLGRS